MFGLRLIQGDKHESPCCKFRPADCPPVTQGSGLYSCCRQSRAQLGNVGLAAGHLVYVRQLVKNKPIDRDGSAMTRRALSGNDAVSDIHPAHQLAVASLCVPGSLRLPWRLALFQC